MRLLKPSGEIPQKQARDTVSTKNATRQEASTNVEFFTTRVSYCLCGAKTISGACQNQEIYLNLTIIRRTHRLVRMNVDTLARSAMKQYINDLEFPRHVKNVIRYTRCLKHQLSWTRSNFRTTSSSVHLAAIDSFETS